MNWIRLNQLPKLNSQWMAVNPSTESRRFSLGSISYQWQLHCCSRRCIDASCGSVVARGTAIILPVLLFISRLFTAGSCQKSTIKRSGRDERAWWSAGAGYVNPVAPYRAPVNAFMIPDSRIATRESLLGNMLRSSLYLLVIWFISDNKRARFSNDYLNL